MTANGISFGSDLLTKCRPFSELLPENWNGLEPMRGENRPFFSVSAAKKKLQRIALTHTKHTHTIALKIHFPRSNINDGRPIHPS
jgi:hypothetical protein